MKIRILLLLFFTLSILHVHSQNLVPNPSFEDTVAGAPCYGAIEGAKYWFNPHGATPDYYTYFPNYCGPVSSVNNPSGFQLARTGNAYAGIYAVAVPSRDYVAIRLNDTLIQGECYFAELFCSLADLSRYSTYRLGMYFTDDTTGMKLYSTNIPVIPQVENSFGNFLSDTMNWMQVSGTFVASGTETFLIIGNFYDDTNTPLDTVLPQSNWQAAYYYIDDVAVIPCDSLSGINDDQSGNNGISIYPNPASEVVKILFNGNFLHTDIIQVINITGQNCTNEISLIKSDSHSIELDISKLSVGVYFIHLNNKAKSYRMHFIKY